MSTRVAELTDVGITVTDDLGQSVIAATPDSLLEVVSAARAAGFMMFTDLCAVDHLVRDPRFDIVVTLTALDPPDRIRIVVGVPGDDPTIPSITPVFAGANFYEREAYDLFGIRFDGHPDLTRILLPDDWIGHPLRKDTPVGSVPVQFKGSVDRSLETRSTGGDEGSA